MLSLTEVRKECMTDILRPPISTALNRNVCINQEGRHRKGRGRMYMEEKAPESVIPKQLRVEKF